MEVSLADLIRAYEVRDRLPDTQRRALEQIISRVRLVVNKRGALAVSQGRVRWEEARLEELERLREENKRLKSMVGDQTAATTDEAAATTTEKTTKANASAPAESKTEPKPEAPSGEAKAKEDKRSEPQQAQAAPIAPRQASDQTYERPPKQAAGDDQNSLRRRLFGGR